MGQQLSATVADSALKVTLSSACTGLKRACLGGFPGSSKNLPAMHELRCPGEGNGNPLQYPCLENPMERGAGQATVQRVAESRTRLSD